MRPPTCIWPLRTPEQQFRILVYLYYIPSTPRLRNFQFVLVEQKFFQNLFYTLLSPAASKLFSCLVQKHDKWLELVKRKFEFSTKVLSHISLSSRALKAHLKPHGKSTQPSVASIMSVYIDSGLANLVTSALDIYDRIQKNILPFMSILSPLLHIK